MCFVHSWLMGRMVKLDDSTRQIHMICSYRCHPENMKVCIGWRLSRPKSALCYSLLDDDGDDKVGNEDDCNCRGQVATEQIQQIGYHFYVNTKPAPREDRHQTFFSKCTTFRDQSPKNSIWFMCETFYCENNQQHLNLLCFSWMISRFHRWFVILSGTNKHLIKLIWIRFINFVSERIHSGGNTLYLRWFSLNNASVVELKCKFHWKAIWWRGARLDLSE